MRSNPSCHSISLFRFDPLSVRVVHLTIKAGNRGNAVQLAHVDVPAGFFLWIIGCYLVQSLSAPGSHRHRNGSTSL
jgi:hypothetical protein